MATDRCLPPVHPTATLSDSRPRSAYRCADQSSSAVDTIDELARDGVLEHVVTHRRLEPG